LDVSIFWKDISRFCQIPSRFERVYLRCAITETVHAQEMKMATTQDKGTALVTGASSGIGAIYADRLAKRGYDLILVARNKARLATLSRRLRNETGRSVETVASDLTTSADLRRIENILRSDSRITTLVNNAGVGSACAFRRRRPRCPAHGDHVIRSMTTGTAHELDGAVGFIF
jgi:NAD(P)-dependent dehydrogenase (short-subunit alcohol dehydrogenase family)